MREPEILAACAQQARPAAVVCVNLHNFKAYNAVRSHADGDRLLAHVEALLRELGPTWRTRGDELVVLAGGDGIAELTDDAAATLAAASCFASEHDVCDTPAMRMGHSVGDTAVGGHGWPAWAADAAWRLFVATP